MTRPTATVARHTLAYATGSVVGGISRLVLVPVIARKLSADEYGVFSLILGTTNLLHLLFELGLVTALIRFHNETDDEAARVRLRSLVFVGMPACDLLIAVPAFLARGLISRALFGTPEHAGLIGVAVGIALFAALFQLFLGHLRAEDRYLRYAALMAVRGAVALATSLVLVLGLDKGVAGLLIGNLAGVAAVSLVEVPRYLLRHGVDLAGARRRLAELLRFGIPLVPSGIGIWALTYLDVYLLRLLAGLSSVGIYSFGSEICLPVAVVLSAIHLAWPSFAFSRAKREGGAEEIARVFRHLCTALAVAALAVALLRREVLAIVGSETFADSVRVVPLLLLGTIIYGVAHLFGTGLQVAGDTRRLPLLVLVAVLVNAALNLLLIPRWHEIGAAAATVLTNALLGVLVLRESNRQFPLPFEVGKLFRVLLAWAIILLGGDAFGTLPLAVGIPVRLGVLALFPLVLVATRAATWHEVRALPGLLVEIVRGGRSA